MGKFEEALDELIDDHIAGPETRDEVISALELKLMALREQAEDEDEDEE